MRPLIYFLSLVFILAFPKTSFAQFTGTFDHSNWELNDSQGGTIERSEAHLILTGSEDSNGSIEYSITPLEDMLISFDWHYESAGVHTLSDRAYYKLNNQHYYLPSSGYDLDQTGTRVVYIEGGTTFSFQQVSDGCCGTASLSISNFSFEVAGDPVGGVSCAGASPVNTGEKILSEADQSGTWHSVTLANIENSKLVISASEYIYAYAYRGTCNSLTYVSSDFGYRPVLMGFSPNETVFLILYNYGESQTMPWTFTIEETGLGESCETAMAATLGENAAVVPPKANYLWYSYTMPESQKVVITSDAFENIEILQGECGSLSYVDGGSSDIEVTDISPGGQFYIRWTTTNSGTDFNWQLSEQDFIEGDVCSTAIQAAEGLNESESDGGYSWFRFTMPNEEGKKLVITSDSPANIRVSEGTCDNFTFNHYGYPNITLAELSPNQEVLIRWDMYSAGTLSWNIAIEDISEGDLCAQPLAVTIGDDNFVPPGTVGELWYELVMPDEEKKLVINSSNSYSTVYVYTGSCENLEYRGSIYESGQLNSLSSGEHVLLRWDLSYDYGFGFTVGFEDFGPGETCASAVTAVVGENSLSTNTEGHYYYSFTMPEGANKKLTLSTNASNYILLHTGSCDGLTLIDQNYYDISVDNLQPGDNIIIEWQLDYVLDFTWNLELEDVSPGEICASAIDASMGTNNTSEAPQWFTYTMPGSGNITISSVGLANTDTYLRVYDACGGTQLAVSNNFQNLQSQVTLNNVAGGTALKILWDDDWSSAGFDWSIALQNVSQSITFDELESRTILDAPFQLEASATSGLPVTFQGNNENVATINGSAVTIVGLGEVTITASQPGDASFNAAQPVMRTLTITKASQTITFGELESKTIIDDDFEIAATSSSGLDVSFHSTEESVATIQGNTITIVGLGQTTITASQPGNDIYNAATPVGRTLVVTKVPQVITFAELPNKTVGDSDFEISSSSSSGLPVTLSSLNTSIATITGNLVTIVGPGTTTIKAEQIGDAIYAAADPIERTLIVKSNQSISFDALPSKTFGDVPFELSASATSGLAVTFKSSSPEIAAVNGNTVTILHAGTVTITASQSGDDLHNPSPSVDRTLVISKATQQITFAPITAKTIGDPAIQLNVSSTSSLPVTVSSSDPALAQIVGATINLLKAGSVTITATQVGNDDYLPASPVAQTFCINPAKPSISANFNNDGAPVLTSSGSSGNQWYRNGVAIGSSTGVTHTVTLAGDYSVVTSAGSCASAPSEAFTVVVTDIPDRETDLKAYPNPATDYLIVEGTKEHAAFEAIGVSGISFKVDSQWIKSSQHTKVVVSELPSGFYSLLVRQGVKSSRVKFIKK